jgi:hypothetical protein
MPASLKERSACGSGFGRRCTPLTSISGHQQAPGFGDTTYAVVCICRNIDIIDYSSLFEMMTF